MNLEDRMCPRQRVLGSLDGDDFAPILRLLGTLMIPISVDFSGNVTCWAHTAIGQQVLTDSITPEARAYWGPMLLRAATVWQRERAAAQAEPPDAS